MGSIYMVYLSREYSQFVDKIAKAKSLSGAKVIQGIVIQHFKKTKR